MKVSAKTFKTRLNNALAGGEKNLDEAIDLYLWARDHLKELHKVDPTYQQADTIIEIQRVFNVEPDTYLRTACRLGGGSTQAHADAGRLLIKRFGYFEAFRADKLLGPDQMSQLAQELPRDAGPAEFRSGVDLLYKKMDALKSVENGEDGESKTKKPTLKARYEELERKVIELQARLEEKDELIGELRRENTWLKKQVVKTVAS